MPEMAWKISPGVPPPVQMAPSDRISWKSNSPLSKPRIRVAVRSTVLDIVLPPADCAHPQEMGRRIAAADVATADPSTNLRVTMAEAPLRQGRYVPRPAKLPRFDAVNLDCAQSGLPK